MSTHKTRSAAAKKAWRTRKRKYGKSGRAAGYKKGHKKHARRHKR